MDRPFFKKAQLAENFYKRGIWQSKMKTQKRFLSSFAAAAEDRFFSPSHYSKFTRYVIIDPA